MAWFWLFCRENIGKEGEAERPELNRAQAFIRHSSFALGVHASAALVCRCGDCS